MSQSIAQSAIEWKDCPTAPVWEVKRGSSGFPSDPIRLLETKLSSTLEISPQVSSSIDRHLECVVSSCKVMTCTVRRMREAKMLPFWTAQDTAKWLNSGLGLPHVAPLAVEKNLTGHKLVEMNGLNWKSIGVTSVSERNLIQYSLQFEQKRAVMENESRMKSFREAVVSIKDMFHMLKRDDKHMTRSHAAWIIMKIRLQARREISTIDHLIFEMYIGVHPHILTLDLFTDLLLRAIKLLFLSSPEADSLGGRVNSVCDLENRVEYSSESDSGDSCVMEDIEEQENVHHSTRCNEFEDEKMR